jgi:hypothetical protein
MTESTESHLPNNNSENPKQKLVSPKVEHFKPRENENTTSTNEIGLEAARTALKELNADEQNPLGSSHKTRYQGRRPKYIDIISYPSNQTPIKVLKNVTIPLVLAEIGLAGMTVAANGPLATHIDPSIAKSLLDATLSTMILSGLSVAGFGFLSSNEKRNTVPYGDYLCVTKSSPLNNPTLSNTFPEISQNHLFGELHFLGQKRVDAYQNSIKVVRSGLEGLYKLAEACEQDDERLEGIETFAGISPIVLPSLRKMGFEVARPTSIPRSTWDKVFGSIFYSINKAVTPKYPIPEREPLAAFISREELVKRKVDFEKFLSK